MGVILILVALIVLVVLFINKVCSDDFSNVEKKSKFAVSDVVNDFKVREDLIKCELDRAANDLKLSQYLLNLNSSAMRFNKSHHATHGYEHIAVAAAIDGGGWCSISSSSSCSSSSSSCD